MVKTCFFSLLLHLIYNVLASKINSLIYCCLDCKAVILLEHKQMEGFRPFMLAVDEPVYVSAKVDLSHARHCRRIVKIRDFGEFLFTSCLQVLDWDSSNQQWRVLRND